MLTNCNAVTERTTLFPVTLHILFTSGYKKQALALFEALLYAVPVRACDLGCRAPSQSQQLTLTLATSVRLRSGLPERHGDPSS